MWPDGQQDITEVTKRPLTAGTLFKNSMVALVDNLASKVPARGARPHPPLRGHGGGMGSPRPEPPQRAVP